MPELPKTFFTAEKFNPKLSAIFLTTSLCVLLHHLQQSLLRPFLRFIFAIIPAPDLVSHSRHLTGVSKILKNKGSWL